MRSLEEKIGQMMMVGFHGTTAPEHILDWLAAGRIGGVYIFSRNIESPQQVRDLIQQCHDAAPEPILVGIDQEGGMVARFRQGFTESPGAMALGASRNPVLAGEVAAMLAREMRALGINWNFAPVADITYDINNPSVGTRSIGTDKTLVSEFVQSQIHGLQREGVAASTKHFPGIGNTAIDTHEALAQVNVSLQFLRQNDFLPFQAAIAANTATVMVSHVMFNELDDEHPSTLSPVIISDLLRGELGFQGVICTDCMEMKAITDHYGAAESAIMAVLAGVDLVMFSHTKALQEQAYEALLRAVQSGRISESRIDASIARIDALREQYRVDSLLPLDTIRSDEHILLAQKAARAGTVLVKEQEGLLPLSEQSTIACIEFASYMDSQVLDYQLDSAFMGLLRREKASVTTLSLPSVNISAAQQAQAQQLAHDHEVVVLLTRNAHTLPEQMALSQHVLKSARQVILVCLRNPYDAAVLTTAGVILCTNGDSTPSLQAAVDALLGKYRPSGQLTVELEQV